MAQGHLVVTQKAQGREVMDPGTDVILCYAAGWGCWGAWLH